MKTLGRSRAFLAVFAVLAWSGCAARDRTPPTAAPSPAASGEGAGPERLKGTSFLSWTPEEQRLGYPNIEKIYPVNVIRRGATRVPLPAAPLDLSSFTYSWKGKVRTLDDFLAEMNVVGVLAIRDGRIVLERYAQGHDAATPWASFSVAKSVTSLLYGAALRDGHIATLDDPVVRHVPELSGTAYEGVTLRHLLQMSSGIAWNDDMRDPASDIAQLPRLNREGGMAAQIAYMGTRPRKAAPGTVFNYNTSETDLAAAILARAAGRSLAEYLSETVWQPFGMESDGYWLTMRGSGLERGGCCISATLRDYGRIGVFAWRGGLDAKGVRRLPEGWMDESTRPSPASPRYGYYWWLRPDGRYFASGAFGQHIEVSPRDRVVVAVQSYWPKAFDGPLLEHNDTFVEALIRAVREEASPSAPEATALDGRPLAAPPIAPDRRKALEENLARAEAELAKDPGDADALIWLGRRTAYLNRFRDAIAVFTRGIALHPGDIRFYRHRGHRYITVREFDRAVADLETAARLIVERQIPDAVEPDGEPNARNIPTSTSHFNVYYHLGLAHYLKGDFERAERAWRECMKYSAGSDDRLVATSDWLYMTLRRQGRRAEADAVLEPITASMTVIENTAYWNRLLLYKGLKTEAELLGPRDDPVDLATYGYGVGNWHLYSGRPGRAREIFRRVVASPQWNAFGFIAAEADLARMD